VQEVSNVLYSTLWLLKVDEWEAQMEVERMVIEQFVRHHQQDEDNSTNYHSGNYPSESDILVLDLTDNRVSSSKVSHKKQSPAKHRYVGGHVSMEQTEGRARTVMQPIKMSA